MISALNQETPIRKGILKMIDVASRLSLTELRNHNGVQLERIAGYMTPRGDPLYTLRVTRVARGLGVRSLHCGFRGVRTQRSPSSSARASNSARASRSFGRPAARLDRMSCFSDKHRQSTSKT